MANDYYNPDGNPVSHASGSSAVMRAEFTSISTAFSLLAPLTGNAYGLVAVNGGASAQTVVPNTSTARQVLLSGGASALPGWSTETYPAPGTSGNVMISDGTNWTSNVVTSGSFSRIVQQVFTGSGTYTYTPTAGMKYCIARMRGGGAGGGHMGTSVAGGASGGSQGEFAEGVFTAAQIGTSQNVTVGSGGAGGTSGSTTGGTGGTTSLGSLLTAVGGNGGTPAGAGGVFGGTGGTGTGIHIAGAASGNGHSNATGMTYTLGSEGAGGGGPGGFGYIDPGKAGVVYGSGGGGGGYTSSAPSNGGAGAAGYLEIIEFI